MLFCEGHLYLIFFSVIQLLITSMAGIAHEVCMTLAHFLMQWPDVVLGIGSLQSVQLEGQNDSCMKYVFKLCLGGSN